MVCMSVITGHIFSVELLIWVWWFTPVITELGRLKQKNFCKLEVSVGYRQCGPCLNFLKSQVLRLKIWYIGNLEWILPSKITYPFHLETVILPFFTHLPILVIVFIQNTYQCDQKNCMITYLFFIIICFYNAQISQIEVKFVNLNYNFIEQNNVLLCNITTFLPILLFDVGTRRPQGARRPILPC